jgi:LPXTG-site transpeptidase (sortase) family protein
MKNRGSIAISIFVYNKFMNQILVTKLNNKINKRKFILIFLISILLLILILNYIFTNINYKNKNNILEDLYSTTLKIQKQYTTYTSNNFESQNNIIFGKIIIPKINLEYIIFQNYSEELLKISVCKFYGPSLYENGNIAIAGHNYDDNRFFSKLNELQIGDEIIIEDINEVCFYYKVNNIYETSPDDFSSLEYNDVFEKELTLVTCNNQNRKRLIIKASIMK